MSNNGSSFTSGKNGDFDTLRVQRLITNRIAVPTSSSSSTLRDLTDTLNTMPNMIVGVSNIGSGEGVFAQENTKVAQFKSLTQGNGITLNAGPSDISISKSGPLAASVYWFGIDDSSPPQFVTKQEQTLHGDRSDISVSVETAEAFGGRISRSVFVMSPAAEGTYRFYVSTLNPRSTKGIPSITNSGVAADSGARRRESTDVLMPSVTFGRGSQFAYFEIGFFNESDFVNRVPFDICATAVRVS